VTRTVAVVAMDPRAEPIVARLAEGSWNQARFLRADAASLPRDIADAELVVMVASAGGDAKTAAAIGAACSDRRITTTGLVVGAASASKEELSGTLAQLRPWSLMVVVTGGDDHVEGMLTALRA
jgi:hypothetical protein